MFHRYPTVQDLVNELEQEHLIKGEIVFEFDEKHNWLKIGAQYKHEGETVTYYLVNCEMKKTHVHTSSMFHEKVKSFYFLNGPVNQGRDLRSLVLQHRLKLAEFLQVEPEDVSAEEFVRYAEGLTHVGLTFNAWRDPMEKFLDSKAICAAHRRQLVYGLVHSTNENLPHVTELLMAGVPLETLEEFDTAPAEWVKKLAGNPQPLIIDDNDQQIFMSLLNDRHTRNS